MHSSYKMSLSVSALENTIISHHAASMISFKKLLISNGFTARNEGATSVYNSFGKGPHGDALAVSINGTIAIFHLWGIAIEVTKNNLPDDDDIVIIVQSTHTAIVMGSDIITPEIRAAMASHHSMEISPFFSAAKELSLRLKAPVPTRQGVLEMRFSQISHGGAGSSPYWMTPTKEIVNAMDAKVASLRDIEIPDKAITRAIVQTHVEFVSANPGAGALPRASGRASAQPPPHHYLFGTSVGEIGVCLAEKLAYDRQNGIIRAHEWHPVFAELLGATLRERQYPNFEIRPSYDWTVDARCTGQNFPNVIGIFPFVKSETYVLGYPEMKSAIPEFNHPAVPNPLIPLLDGKRIGAVDHVGALDIRVMIMSMVPGSIGTFLVPVSIGTVASLGERAMRTTIVVYSEILSFARIDKNHAILVVRRRQLPIQIYTETTEIPPRLVARSVESSNGFVRWIGNVPVFVFDTTIVGMHAGTQLQNQLLGMKVFRDIARPMSAAIYNRSTSDGNVGPNHFDGWLPLYGTNQFANPDTIDLQKIALPAVFVGTKHDGGKITIEPIVGVGKIYAGPSAIVAGTDHFNDIVKHVTSPEIARWIDAVSTSSTFTADMFISIPGPARSTRASPV